MIKSYENFKDSIERLIIFRAKNFAVTDCDVGILIDIVYTDIANEINLKYEKYPYLISDDTMIILPKNDTAKVSEITVTYKDVFDIVDEDDNTIVDEIIKTDTDQYRYVHDEYREKNKGKQIFFIRSIIPDISTLDNRMYNKLSNAMVEGIMYQIQESIPAPTDRDMINFTIQRYFKAKEALLNSLPQVSYVRKRVLYGTDSERI